jgi:UDP-N-acetylenolpyruvoylglucosamine reductase
MSQRAAIPDYPAAGASPETTVVSNDQLFSELKAAVSPDAVLRTDERLAGRTTLRVGGNADYYTEPASEADLTRLLQVCERNALPFFILGRGSNLLIKDGGIRGLVICLMHPHFSRVEVTGYHLHCGAGAKLKQVSVLAKQSQLTGLEFLEGIPGTVGGALRMNAGAMGGWMFDVVESVRYMDHSGQAHEEPAAQVKVEYRSCLLFKENIALGAVLKGHPSNREVVEKRMKTFSQKRWDSQPAAPSAGCIFKNPGAIPAGKLIDELGLKGTRIGGAAVSGEHGNFIINEGTASARDVLELIELIRQKAKTERGIDLETEVEIVGEE